MEKKKVQLDFKRFEFKYILTQEVSDLIEAEVSKFMILDPYVADKKDKIYIIRSLYFDDLLYTKYYEKLDGMKKREKFRVRTYTTDYHTQADAYLEIKGRYNAVTYKHRTPIEHGNKFLHNLTENQTIEEILHHAGDSPVKNRFSFDLGSSTMHPIMVIDYKRRPYNHPTLPGFRITFDKELMAKPGHTLHSKVKRFPRSVLKGYTIMEVKPLGGLPLWFLDIIQRYQLRRVSISKIVAGMNAWHVTPRLE